MCMGFNDCEFSISDNNSHISSIAQWRTSQKVAAKQNFSIEFEDRKTNRLMSFRFWKGITFCEVFICRSGLPSTSLTGELGSLSRLLSVLSLGLISLPAQDVQWTSYGPLTTIPPSRAVCKVAFHSIGSTFRHSCTSPATVCSGGSVFFSVLQCLLVSLG